MKFFDQSRFELADSLEERWFSRKSDIISGIPEHPQQVGFLIFEIVRPNGLILEKFELVTHSKNQKELKVGESLFFKSQRIPGPALRKYSEKSPNVRVYKIDGVILNSKTKKPVDWKTLKGPEWIKINYQDGSVTGVPRPEDVGQYLIETFGTGKFNNDLYKFKVVIDSSQFFYRTGDSFNELLSPRTSVSPIPDLGLNQENFGSRAASSVTIFNGEEESEGYESDSSSLSGSLPGTISMIRGAPRKR
jgi:hypothetical protein